MVMASAAASVDLAAAARRLTATQVSLRERRRFRRLPLTLGGRLLDSAGREHECRTADISPGDVRIAAPTPPAVGDRVVIYLEGLGRLTGSVARRCGEGEAAIIFDFSARKREKLAEQLTLAINKDLVSEIAGELGESVRASGADRARIEFETGEVVEGEILDFSLAGLTVRTLRPPPLLGAWVRVGNVYGRVARLIKGGFAIDFEPRKQA
jgi:hypothetical protein